jgi:uncharacterized membrane protein
MILGTILAGNDDTIYGIVLFLHILAVIVGFGPTFVYPVYSAMAKKRPGPEGLAINQVTLDIAHRFEWAIYLVPIFGIILVPLSDGGAEFSFGDPWISASFLAYLVALGISLGLHQPNLRALVGLQGQIGPGGPTPEQGRELEERGKKAGMFGGILHLLLVVILWLMIFKPGWP